jgi:hypothetical protein
MRNISRDLDLGRDEAAKAVNSLLAQGELRARDRDGNEIEEVPPRNQPVLLVPARAKT